MPYAEWLRTSCFLAAQQSPHLWHTMHCTRSGCSLSTEDDDDDAVNTSRKFEFPAAPLPATADFALMLLPLRWSGCNSQGLTTAGCRLHSSLGPMILWLLEEVCG